MYTIPTLQPPHFGTDETWLRKTYDVVTDDKGAPTTNLSKDDDVVDNIAGGQQQLVFSDIENETGYFFKSIYTTTGCETTNESDTNHTDRFYYFLSSTYDPTAYGKAFSDEETFAAMPDSFFTYSHCTLLSSLIQCIYTTCDVSLPKSAIDTDIPPLPVLKVAEVTKNYGKVVIAIDDAISFGCVQDTNVERIIRSVKLKTLQGIKPSY
eukprot:g642.t1